MPQCSPQCVKIKDTEREKEKNKSSNPLLITIRCNNDLNANALVFGETQTWGYAQSTRVHSRATTGCLRFVRMLRMLVLCTPQHNPAHHAKSCNPVTVRELTHTRKSYFVAWTVDARMDKVTLTL